MLVEYFCNKDVFRYLYYIYCNHQSTVNSIIFPVMLKQSKKKQTKSK